MDKLRSLKTLIHNDSMKKITLRKCANANLSEESRSKRETLKCAISNCGLKAHKLVEHDDNFFAIPLCITHLDTYTKDLDNFSLSDP